MFQHRTAPLLLSAPLRQSQSHKLARKNKLKIQNVSQPLRFMSLKTKMNKSRTRAASCDCLQSGVKIRLKGFTKKAAESKKTSQNLRGGFTSQMASQLLVKYCFLLLEDQKQSIGSLPSLCLPFSLRFSPYRSCSSL